MRGYKLRIIGLFFVIEFVIVCFAGGLEDTTVACCTVLLLSVTNRDSLKSRDQTHIKESGH